MTKQFKHPKLGRIARPAKDDDIRVKELIIGKYDLFIKEGSYDLVNNHRMSAETLLALGFEEETLQAGHFGNGMTDGGDCFYVNTSGNFDDGRIDAASDCDDDWAIFQTKEQAQQFDKMMMTVWKIWKWKKENDDGHIDRSDRDLKKYSLSYDFDGCSFLGIYGIFTCYDFILPRFTSKEKVIQLISDLGEEELNNLLCWNYPGKK